MKCLVVIPCYNDHGYLEGLVAEIKKQTQHILIIDDGSDDKVRNVYDCSMIRNKTNSGKGYSIKKGIQYAASKNFTHLITIDSDGQHDPCCIKEFIEFDKNVDIVIGKRRFDSSMPFHRKISNVLTSFILSILTKYKIEDSQCGYRRYKIDSIVNLSFYENGFQFESEILIKALRKGCTLNSILIPTIYSAEKSSIKNISDSFKFIKLITKNFLNS